MSTGPIGIFVVENMLKVTCKKRWGFPGLVIQTLLS